MMTKIIRTVIAIFLFLIVTPAQLVFAESGIQINSHAMDAADSFINKTVVDFIITDPAGYRVGYDPRTATQYKEFNAGYGDGGVDEFYTVEAGIIPVDGTYTIEIIGDGLMQFSLSISIYREIKGAGFTDFDFNGLTAKNLTSKFQFTYTSDPSKPAGTATKIATSSSLKQDIILSRKVGWITNDGIMNSLLKKAEAVEASIAKGNKNAAKNQLNAFINEVNAQKGKGIDEKAVKMLLEDVKYIMENI